jgi:hypothetical protein
MSYNKLKDCWTGLVVYNLSGKKTGNTRQTVENYVPPVTMPFSEWQKYVGSGANVLLGSGGVISSGTVNTGFGGGGAVYKGHVRQGYMI